MKNTTSAGSAPMTNNQRHLHLRYDPHADQHRRHQTQWKHDLVEQ
jgi:hypothetical protein